MRKFFSSLLLSVAICTSAQDVIFQNTQGIFNKQMLLNELLNIKHTIGADGIDSVTIQSRNGATYSTPAKDVKATTTQVEECSLQAGLLT